MSAVHETRRIKTIGNRTMNQSTQLETGNCAPSSCIQSDNESNEIGARRQSSFQLTANWESDCRLLAGWRRANPEKRAGWSQLNDII